MTHQADLEYAQQLDLADPLAEFRDQFLIPRQPNGEPTIYLCGNSLGLQAKGVRRDLAQECDDWARLGVEGHFEARDPWYAYHESFSHLLADIVGGEPEEIVVMNSLTTNLHLMMISFYQPTAERYKILMEDAAFPSDHYAVDSQAKLHGFDPREAVIKLEARPGEETLRDEDVLEAIAEAGSELALVMLGGVNYYTGQVFDFESITKAGHEVGARVGFDLAHAAGNVELKLHDWGVDFAVWCSYKYLNAGPGATAGCFVHERWADSPELPRLAGWWGYDAETRFEMKPEFVPQRGAEGWQLSNAPVFSMVPLKASLALFNEVGMPALRKKSLALTDYLLFLIDRMPADSFEVITPREPARRGSQVSLKARENGRELFEALQKGGVICDYREPNVIRVAPAPLYNSYADVWRFCDILRRTVEG
jgi:kynureninase